MGKLHISIRLSRCEKEKLIQNANSQKKEVSEFIRDCCINKWQPPMPSIGEFLIMKKKKNKKNSCIIT
jgi:hypothetical protein